MLFMEFRFKEFSGHNAYGLNYGNTLLVCPGFNNPVGVRIEVYGHTPGRSQKHPSFNLTHAIPRFQIYLHYIYTNDTKFVLYLSIVAAHNIPQFPGYGYQGMLIIMMNAVGNSSKSSKREIEHAMGLKYYSIDTLKLSKRVKSS
jgi:hypothetical protein